MREFLLDVSQTGVQHKAHISHDGDELIVEEFTPTHIEDEILDDCARLRSLHQKRGAFQLAAKVPINTHAAWRKEWRKKYSQDFTWQTFLTMKLNSRDNAKLRTGNKRGGSMLL